MNMDKDNNKSGSNFLCVSTHSSFNSDSEDSGFVPSLENLEECVTQCAALTINAREHRILSKLYNSVIQCLAFLVSAGLEVGALCNNFQDKEHSGDELVVDRSSAASEEQTPREVFKAANKRILTEFRRFSTICSPGLDYSDVVSIPEVVVTSHDHDEDFQELELETKAM